MDYMTFSKLRTCVGELMFLSLFQRRISKKFELCQKKMTFGFKEDNASI